MLAIARALLTNPRVILMDEPSEGLAPVIVERLVGTMRKMVGDGELALLLVEQRIDVALDLARRCIVMDRGRITHEAASAAFRGGAADLATLIGLGGQA